MKSAGGRSAGDPVRSRVGLLVPSTNTVMEPDLAGGLDGAASLHVMRMPLVDVTAEAERAMIEASPGAAASLRGTGIRACVFGCTSAAAILGISGASRLCRELAAVCGAPVISVLECAVSGLRSHGAHRVAVFTPYDDILSAAVADHFTASGFSVVSVAGMGLHDNGLIGSLRPDEITSTIVDRLSGGTNADALFVSCTNLRAVEARSTIAEALGLPVVTSNSAVIDVLTRSLERSAPVLP